MAKLSWRGAVAGAAPSLIAVLLALNPGSPHHAVYLIPTQGSSEVFSTGTGVGSGGLSGYRSTPMVAPYGDVSGRGTNADKPLTPRAPPPIGSPQAALPTFGSAYNATNNLGANGFGANDLGSGVGSGSFGGTLPPLNSNRGH